MDFVERVADRVIMSGGQIVAEARRRNCASCPVIMKVVEDVFFRWRSCILEQFANAYTGSAGIPAR